MKLAFAGTPEFAAIILDALVRSRHCVAAVFTRHDARAGRGKRVTQSAVKRRALTAGIEVHQPRGMRNSDAAETLGAVDPDLLVVAAYGFLLPASILAIPRLGCINVHASVLPRWRGAAPVHHAILAGDARTGVSIMADGFRTRFRTDSRRADLPCCLEGHHGLADRTPGETRRGGAPRNLVCTRVRCHRGQGTGRDACHACAQVHEIASCDRLGLVPRPKSNA